ncbi:MAG: metallophosphoesterase [Planctomycetia bacterium]|nr:metallophosphoesterase [Planctomycetia bacterium]
MKTSRKRSLRRVVAAALVAAVSVAGASCVAPRYLEVTRIEISIANLPAEFDGLTIAVLSDIHHGAYYSLKRVREVVELANGLGADVVVLPGDFTSSGRIMRGRIAACIGELAKLQASMGVYAVLGNHDLWADAALTRQELARAGIVDLTNTGVWLRKGQHRLRLAGVGDLWTEKQDLASALGDAAEDDVAVLLSHNPDYAAKITDSRVRLVLSGHTHGGQVCFPPLGSPFVLSWHGQKYRAGFVKAPHSQVYVSRGIGVMLLPVRLFCRPELPLVTLRAAR